MRGSLPENTIQAINFPPRKPKVEVPAGEAAAKPAVKVEASKVVETPKAEAVRSFRKRKHNQFKVSKN